MMRWPRSCGLCLRRRRRCAPAPSQTTGRTGSRGGAPRCTRRAWPPRSAAGRGGGPAWAGLWRPLALTGVAAAVAVLAVLGLTTEVFRFGADTTSAQVNGVVSRVDPDAIILITADGRVSVRIAENTIVLDANGNPINGGEITPGRSARVEVEEEDGEYSAQRIEVEDED